MLLARATLQREHHSFRLARAIVRHCVNAQGAIILIDGIRNVERNGIKPRYPQQLLH
jgi:hypothetical protein